MGKSDKSKAAEELYKEIGKINSNVNNRFDNFKFESSTKDILNAVNTAFNSQINDVNANTKQNIATAKSGIGKSLRSRGLTSGSMFDEIVGAAGNDAMTQGAGIISQLRSAKLGAVPGILQSGNQNQLSLTRLAQGADQQNFNNLLAKFGIKAGAVEGLDDSTMFDDILSILTTGSNFINPLSSLFGGAGGATKKR